MKGEHFPRRMLENAELSWADAPPEGDKVTEGAWWTDGDAAEIAVGEGVAKRLHVGVGSASGTRNRRHHAGAEGGRHLSF